MVPMVVEHGGRLVFSGAVSWLMLGQADDMWDQVAVVEYPNRAALLAMSTSERTPRSPSIAPPGSPDS